MDKWTINKSPFEGSKYIILNENSLPTFVECPFKYIKVVQYIWHNRKTMQMENNNFITTYKLNREIYS